MIKTELKEKVAIITGANSPLGIGASIAKAFSAEGARCFLTYLRTPGQRKDIPQSDLEKATEPGWELYMAMGMKSAEGVLEEIREAGGTATAWEADLAKIENIPILFDKAEAQYGPVSILVNYAAHCPDKDTLLDLTADSINLTYAVNTRAALLLIAEYVKRYKKHKLESGRIINVSTDEKTWRTGGHCEHDSLSRF